MINRVSVAVVLCLSLFSHSNTEDSCNTTENDGGIFVGFTALTPEQLKKEIRTNLKVVMSELANKLDIEREIEEQSRLEAIEELNYTITSAVATIKELNQRLEQSITSNIKAAVQRQIKFAVTEILENITLESLKPEPVTKPTTTEDTDTEHTEHTEHTTQAPITLPPIIGTRGNPATSCKQIYESLTNPPSGMYWVIGSPNKKPTEVYCDMTRTCGGVKGGWMQVAHINMTDPDQTCPKGFTRSAPTLSTLYTCTTVSEARGCFGTNFSTEGVSYSRICGKVIGYQDGTPNAFYNYHINPSLTIDEVYVDGISLTRGSPRQHVWTFVSALDETDGHFSGCRCSNIEVHEFASIPPFVGNDYFCDTGSRGPVGFEFYGDDPLWDGKGCGSVSECCSFNNPPWFSKELPASSTDNLELRVCRDSGVNNEDIPFEIVELYVR